MLRITENLESKKTVRLRLDGTILPDSFEELAAQCARHRLDGDQTIIVDMAGVIFMNHEAARKLAQMRTEAVRIINCSPFIATLLDAAKSID
jgi:anti-anti-sigma regulatory factor